MKKPIYLPFSILLIIFSTAAYSQNPTLVLEKELISNSEMGQPWGMCFISSDELLFTEKSGKLFRYIISTDTKTQITGTPTVTSAGQGGLLDVALHPDFATNNYVYLSYSISGNGGNTLAIGRGILNGNQLTGFSEIFRALPFTYGTNHYGSRLVFDNEKHLLFSASDRQEQNNAQLLSNHLGKVIRLNDDGSVPSDNPFVGENGAKPEIYSYGHRNIQGLSIHAKTGKIYAHEHGPKGGDELNLIEAGKNYGWPSITFGLDYNGSIISSDTAREGMEQPIKYWVPSIAPSGLAIVPLEGQAENEVNFVLGALAGKQIQWVTIQDDKHVATYSFMNNHARFRDIEVSPDGKIYALTESPNSLILLGTNQVITETNNTAAKNTSMLLYPNPAQDFVQIDAKDFSGQNFAVNIYSGEGRLMQTIPADAFSQSSSLLKIDIKAFPSGMYLIELKSDKANKTFRCQKL
jgi:glucose/arabinose dehydrogenase